MKQTDKYICLLNISKIQDEFLNELISVLSGSTVKHIELKSRFDSELKELLKHPTIKLNETQTALIEKVNHMYYKGAGFLDIISMLDSFKRGVKRLKTAQTNYYHEKQYEWTDKDGNDKLSHENNLPNAHFKWNGGTRYVLSSKDLTTIADFIKPIVNHLNYEHINIY